MPEISVGTASEIKPHAGSVGEVGKAASASESYFELTSKVLEADLADIRIRSRLSWVFVLGVSCLFGWIFWEGHCYLNSYLCAVANKTPVPRSYFFDHSPAF